MAPMSPFRPVSWLREHPFAADAWFAAGVAAISVTFHLTLRMDGSHRPVWWGVLLCLGATLPLAWRRRSPAIVLVSVTLFQMALEAFNLIGPDWVGVLTAAYTLGAYRSGRVLWRLGALALAVVFTFVIVGVVHGDAPWQALLSSPVIFIGALVLGDNVRRRRERTAELAERAERAERERHLLAHQHVMDERARIARELHDVVAHSVSLMVIQTAAARRQLRTDVATADSALATVEETGRLAMQEMRRMLGVLRDEQAVPDRTPQPGLAAIEGLTRTAADLPVEVSITGALDSVPQGVEVNAYRIVQEALTNVRRHAGPVQMVRVSVVCASDALTVEVDDDGRGGAAPDKGGFGLTGMRERVAAFDGRLVTGPRPGGGWRVRAVFPLVPA